MEDKLASEQIDTIIQKHGGWKGEILSQLRAEIKQADADVVEEIKWKMATRPEGLPVWTHGGIVCFAETWKDNVKLIFPKGSQMTDPKKLFNARLKSATVRAIEFREGDSLNQAALRELVIEAVAINASN
jgi:hypothetical protein